MPPEHPATPRRQFHLSAASTALVAQAHTQAAGGDYGPAAATLERALRIEPDNPLLWIELGRVRLGENNPSQADALGRKALSLATGDASAQASAWHLIADALRARGRNGEAADAERRAQGLRRVDLTAQSRVGRAFPRSRAGSRTCTHPRPAPRLTCHSSRPAEG